MTPVPSKFARLAQQGMTLIEVLVGIAIGLIGMLVMFQMVTVWDARTRVNASSGDAQVAGTLAMFNLERDVRLGGMGFGTAKAAEVGCVVNAYDGNASGTANFNLQPVTIIDGDGAGVPDQIQVLYGASPFSGDGQDFTGGTATTLAATVKYSFKRGDLAVATNNANTCKLLQITDDTTADDRLLSFGYGSYADYYDGNPAKSVRWNSASASMPVIAAGRVYSLGPSPRLNVWSVDTTTSTLGYVNRLPVVAANPFFGVAEGVVDMKAEYGYGGTWTKAAPADWTQLRAIRIGMLVRSREFAKPPAAADSSAVTYRLTGPPTWFNHAFVMKDLNGGVDTDVAGSPNNWRYYRYRVYEKVIPLRNMIWGQS